MSYRYQQKYIQNPYVFNNLISTKQNNNFHNRRIDAGYNASLLINSKNNQNFYQNGSLYQNKSLIVPNSEVSHARNFKHRLYEADKTQQIKKQVQKVNYRKQLEMQIKADKQRKQKEKRDLQKYQMQRERKFYEEINKYQKIQAVKKQTKQQPSYFMLRSSKSKRTKTNNNLDISRSLTTKLLGNETQQQSPSPKIIKRGGYNNKSSLDNFQSVLPQPPKQISPINPINHKKSHTTDFEQRQLEIIKERNYQQQRISNIIKLQQKMLKKLDIFKQQIYKTKHQFRFEEEIQKLRNKLKANPVKLDNVISVRDNEIFYNNKDFYHLPAISMNKNEVNKLRNRSSRERQLNSKEYSRESRLNMENSHLYKSKSISQRRRQIQDQGQEDYQQSLKKQIKLFDKTKVTPQIYNDKNDNFTENQVSLIPVVNTKDNIKGVENPEQNDHQ